MILFAELSCIGLNYKHHKEWLFQDMQSDMPTPNDKKEEQQT